MLTIERSKFIYQHKSILIMHVINKWPFYLKLTCSLLIIISISFISIIGKQVLVPLILGFLLSILLTPLCDFFEKFFRIPRTVSSIITTLLFASIILGLFYLIILQLAEMANEWPKFQKQIIDTFNSIQKWIHHNFGINSRTQLDYLSQNVKSTIETSTFVLEKVITVISSATITIVFTFLYVVFLLIYRRHLVKFLYYAFNSSKHDQIYNVITAIQKVIKQYLIGLFLQMIIVSAMTFIGFYILGLKYSFILALLTGVLNIIPYVGITISLIITTIVTFATMSSAKIFFILITYAVVHAIDGNIIMPKIVGSKVKLNSLVVVIGLVIGEMTWGIMGMFLSIPVLALSKIIFDNINDLKPWGYLIGDVEETEIDDSLNKFLARKRAEKKKKNFKRFFKRKKFNKEK